MRKDYEYSDVARGLQKDVTGDIDVDYDAQAIIQSVKNILSTVPNERVRNPVGSSLIRYLFEPMNRETADDIKDEVKNILGRWEPRIQTMKINVKPDYDRQTYHVSLKIRAKNLMKEVEYDLLLRSLGGDV